MAPRPTAPDGSESDPITFSVTIEAVLKTVLPVPRLDLTAVNSEEQPPADTAVEENSSVAALPEPVYKAPVFRFKFLDGSQEETPMMPLGDEPNDGWEEVEVVDVQNVVLDSEENALEGSLSGEKKEEEKNDGAAEELDGEALDKGPSTIIKPKRWKWTKDFVVNDGVTEDLARKIHSDPNVVCVLANLLSKVEPTDENDNGDEEESPPAKDANFLGFLPLDASAFLDGDTSVSLTMSAEDYSLPDPPAGLLHWSFRVSTERPLLTREQRKMWNPLVINTRKVRCLPGVMLETNNPSMMKYMQPTRFSFLPNTVNPFLHY